MFSIDQVQSSMEGSAWQQSAKCKAYLPGDAGSHSLKEARGIVKQVLKTQSHHHLSQEERVGCIAECMTGQLYKGGEGRGGGGGGWRGYRVLSSDAGQLSWDEGSKPSLCRFADCCQSAT